MAEQWYTCPACGRELDIEDLEDMSTPRCRCGEPIRVGGGEEGGRKPDMKLATEPAEELALDVRLLGEEEQVTYPCHHCGATLEAPAWVVGFAMPCTKCGVHNVPPSASMRAVPPVFEALWKLLSKELGRLYRHVDIPLGTAFVIEVQAYLLFRMGWQMERAECREAVRAGVMGLCEHHVGGAGLRRFRRERGEAYTHVALAAGDFDRAVVATHVELLDFAQQSPNDRRKLTLDPIPSVEREFWSHVFLAEGMGRLEQRRIAPFCSTLAFLVAGDEDFMNMSAEETAEALVAAVQGSK